jgi:hemoglobin
MRIKGKLSTTVFPMIAMSVATLAVAVTVMAGGPPKDGELALPDYKGWPKFLAEVQRPDAKQVREIYINPAGTKASHGQPFPDGTQFVMELYKAKADGDKLVTGADGKLAKGDLAKVFVMGKDKGWGEGVPDNLKNGAWVFSAYGPDGRALAEDFTKCRACHAPLAQKDFVHRYDEYFEQQHHGK